MQRKISKPLILVIALAMLCCGVFAWHLVENNLTNYSFLFLALIVSIILIALLVVKCRQNKAIDTVILAEWYVTFHADTPGNSETPFEED